MTSRDKFIGTLRQLNLPEDRISALLSDLSDQISPEGLNESYEIMTDFILLVRKTERRRYEAIPLIQIMTLNLLATLKPALRQRIMANIIRFFMFQDTGVDLQKLIEDEFKRSLMEKPTKEQTLSGYA